MPLLEGISTRFAPHHQFTAPRERFPALAARPREHLVRHPSDARTERTVSPQRIVHYRETWYLDAWDDSRDALRSFATDRVLRATVLEEDALDVPDEQMDEHYTTAYGIFGGKADKLAVLRFTPERARWVADERWHPEQEGTWLPDGCFSLSVPYRQSRELVMDILRHGSGVEVVSPRELVEEVRAELEAARGRYTDAY